MAGERAQNNESALAVVPCRCVCRNRRTASTRLTVTGTAAGLIVAYAAGRAVAGSIYAMRASDPMILVAAATVVVVITLVSTAIPAAAAARIDPVVALRSE